MNVATAAMMEHPDKFNAIVDTWLGKTYRRLKVEVRRRKTEEARNLNALFLSLPYFFFSLLLSFSFILAPYE